MSSNNQEGEAKELRIANNLVVELHYSLHDEQGQELESTRGAPPSAFLVGHRGMLAGLEQALIGHKAGAKLEVKLPPERAFGLRDEELKDRISKKYFKNAKRLHTGMQTQVTTKDGPRLITIVKVGSKTVDIDLNHPRAGQSLRFDVEIVAVRQATADELSHGHAHGVGGHQH